MSVLFLFILLALDVNLLFLLGIMPDVEIERLLKCTVLVITSPSFGMQDSRRLSSIAVGDLNRWLNIRSMMVFGTRMGESGLNMLLSLGVSHFQVKKNPKTYQN